MFPHRIFWLDESGSQDTKTVKLPSAENCIYGVMHKDGEARTNTQRPIKTFGSFLENQ